MDRRQDAAAGAGLDEAHGKPRRRSDLPVAMRDGTLLRADVYRPDSPGPFAVLLCRTPYD